MKRILLAAVLVLAAAAALPAQIFTITVNSSGATNIVTTSAATLVTVFENASVPSAAFSITDPANGPGVTLNLPVGGRYTFMAKPGYPRGSTIGTVQAAAGSGFTFVVVQRYVEVSFNVTQLLNPLMSSTTGGSGTALNVQSLAADPGTCTNAQIWYNTTSNTYKICPNGAVTAIAAGGSVTTVPDLTPLGTFATRTTTPAWTLSTQLANLVFGNCTVSTAAPSFCALTPGMEPSTTVNSVTNDTNIQGSITGQALTFAWAGTLAKARIIATAVYNDQGNTFSTGTQDFSAVTLFKMRVSAGLTSSVNGDLGYDTTNKNWHIWANAVDNINLIMPASISPANNDCAKFTVAAGVVTLNTAGAACGSTGFTNPMTSPNDMIIGGTAGAATRLAGPTTYAGVAQVPTSTSSGGVAGAVAWAPGGVTPNPQTGTTYTVALTDRLKYVSFSNASAIAVTLPQAGSSNFDANFAFIGCDIGAGTATITPTTSTISYSTGSAYSSAQTTLALTTGQCAWVYSDNTNYFAVKFSGGAGGGVSSFSGDAGSVFYNNSASTGAVTATLATQAAGAILVPGSTNAFPAPGASAVAPSWQSSPEPLFSNDPGAWAYLSDDFSCAAASGAVVGCGNWGVNGTGATATTYTGAGTYWGAEQCATGTTASNACYINQATFTFPGYVNFTKGDIKIRAKLGQTTNTNFFGGIVNVNSGHGETTAGYAGIAYNVGKSDTGWMCVVYDGTTATRTAVTGTLDTAFHTFRIRWTAAKTIACSVDGGTETGLANTHFPTDANETPEVSIDNNATANNVNFAVDYYYHALGGVSR